jgi:hypothetical protein
MDVAPPSRGRRDQLISDAFDKAGLHRLSGLASTRLVSATLRFKL